MPGKISFLIAPARSGKSTFANKWMDESDLDTEHYRVVVNSDRIRLELHGQRYISLAEPFVFAFTELMVRTLYNSDYHVLVDETNCTQGSIRKWLSIDINAEAIFIDTPKEVCIERAYASNQCDLVEKGVIDRHFDNLEKLVRTYHPDIGVRMDGMRTYEELITSKRVYEAIECIRKEIKKGERSS